MLGDYMQYNERPSDRRSKSKTTAGSGEKLSGSEDLLAVPELSAALDEEDGYDPYNHPIDRRFLE